MEAELTLWSEPDAVPRARRLVRSVVGEHLPDVAADAELVVSELVTNATLHGEPPITVRVMLGENLRLEVRDAGRSAPILVGSNLDAMTGRGLSMVAAVASAWGVSPVRAGGKVVWAELSPGGAYTEPAGHPEVDIDRLLEAWSDDEPSSGTYTVRLGSVSTELLLSAKAHIDNVVRELMLMREGEASSGVPLAPEMAELVQTVTVDFAGARSEIKRQAAAAAARHEPMTQLELQLTADAADAGERYLAALEQSDRYARSAHLLTLAPPPAHRIFRRWYVGSLVSQLRAMARGEPPQQPPPLQLVLAGEVARLSELAEASGRLRLVERVTRELAEATSSEDMARVVVDSAVGTLGIETAHVRLLIDGRLRSVAWAGTVAGPPPLAEYPIDADLPGAEAVRTRRPVFIRSLHESFGDLPGMGGHYRSGRSGRVMPLVVGDQVVGTLSLTFVSGELTHEAESDAVEALSHALAQGLKRVELALLEARTRDSLGFLADATELVLAAPGPPDVMERLVNLAVPRLADWCTVYLADGRALRRAAMAISGHPGLVDGLKERPLAVDADVPQARSFRSGMAESMDWGVGRLLREMYPGVDLGAIGGDPDRSSGLCVPVELRGERIGVIALSFFDGRHVTPLMTQTIEGLAARAAIAFDVARRWSAQQEMIQELVAALLPPGPPEVPGLEIEARYLGSSGNVAGDWWEAQVMADGSLLLGVGDAAGHGVGAVSKMAELRQGALALARVHGSPAAVLADLNRSLEGLDGGFATAAYGRFRPQDGTLVWASSGHVPPVLLRPGRAPEVLTERSGPPLGSPEAAQGPDQHLRLEPGDTLLLYTDGVVERRLHDLGEGIARLARTAAAHSHEPLAVLADRIVAEYCEAPTDDCCVLLVRRS